MRKRIEYILAGKEKQITKDEVVIQPLPHKDFRFANPFIVLHHLREKTILPGQELRIHPHPHRGFSPVTFQLQGEGFHKDNIGNDYIIKAGDVQWMFAGKGIMHSEGPSSDILKNGGKQELIQLWINAPQARKWDNPYYQHVAKDKLPQAVQQEGVEFKLASGTYEGHNGPLKSFTPVISMLGKIDKGSRVQLTAIPGYWTLLYIAKGSVEINLESVKEFNLVVFEKENEEIILTAEEDAVVLYLSAEPINEPVAARDNFVMNTVEEIDQALEDAKNGVFGTLEF